MAKNNNKSYAEQGLEEVQEASNQAEQYVNASDTGNGGSEEFVQVGGLEPVAYFYRTSAPKKPTNSPFKILEKGQTIIGKYERSFVSGKFSNPTFLIRLDSTKELVGLPGAGSLTKAMYKLAEGSKVKITYQGMAPIKGGEWEGTDAHSFIVMGTILK